MSDAIAIDPRDNVATALRALSPGDVITVLDRAIAVQETVPAGHKVAIDTIGPGDAVVKYGSPIGRALSAIAPGTHVHTHNLASTRGRGDLDASPAAIPAPLEPSGS